MSDVTDLIERSLFLASGQDDLHSETIIELVKALRDTNRELVQIADEAADALERLNRPADDVVEALKEAQRIAGLVQRGIEDMQCRRTASESCGALIAHLDAALATIKQTDAVEAERDDLAACERAIDRMGWPEIHAFMNEPGQSPHEDAGGFLLRKIKALFGIRPTRLETYQEAARRLVNEAREQAAIRGEA